MLCKCDLIDLRTIRPIDWRATHQSVAKTGRLLALDTRTLTSSVSVEIVTRTVEDSRQSLQDPAAPLTMPDYPEATSPVMA